MEEGRGPGYWLLLACWLLLVLPALCLAAYVAAPPKWRVAIGLPDGVRQEAQAVSVSGRLAPLSEALQSGEIAQGQPAWRQHRQPPPAVAASTPMIALVLTGLGRDESLVTDVLALPGGVTLSFTPYGRPFDVAMSAAAEEGHELLLDLPMEDEAAPDLGPQALLTLLDVERNLQRLGWLLDGPEGDATPPVVGVAVVGGSAFLAAPDLAGPVLQALAERGLIFLDGPNAAAPAGPPPAAVGLPTVLADKRLGRQAGDEVGAEGAAGEAAPDSLETLQRQLAELERAALLNGSAVAIARADAALLPQLAPWLATLDERGYALAPLSAVLERRLTADAAR